MKLVKTCCLGLVLLAGAAPLQAAFVSFQELLDGATLTVGNLQFSEFTVDFLGLGGPVDAPDYEQIDVVPLTADGLSAGHGLRFDFNEQLSVAGVTEGGPLELLEFIDLTWSFTVTTLIQKNQIDSNLLLLDAQLTNPTLDAGVFILEQVFSLTDELLATKTAEVSFLEPDEFVDDPIDSAVFLPQSAVRVTKNIFVGASVDGEVADVISVTQRFGQVPVPATSLLLALGLAGISLVRRPQVARA